jgi:hypothetical protein
MKKFTFDSGLPIFSWAGDNVETNALDQINHLANQSDLVEIVTELTPLAVIKG